MKTFLTIFLLVNAIIGTLGMTGLFYIVLSDMDNNLANELREAFEEGFEGFKKLPILFKIISTPMLITALISIGYIAVISIIVNALETFNKH